MNKRNAVALTLLVVAMFVMAACEVPEEETVVTTVVIPNGDPTATPLPVWGGSNSDGSPIQIDTRIEFERIKVNRTDGGSRSEYVIRFYDTEQRTWCWFYDGAMDCS